MGQYNKQFSYKGYEFNICVELFTRTQQQPNLSSWHTITTNCMGGNNYYVKDEVPYLELEHAIERHKQKAKEFIDKLTVTLQTYEEVLLSNLGFTKTN